MVNETRVGIQMMADAYEGFSIEIKPFDHKFMLLLVCVA